MENLYCPMAQFKARVSPPEKQTPVESKFKLVSVNSSGFFALLHAKTVLFVLELTQKIMKVLKLQKNDDRCLNFFDSFHDE